MSKEFKPLPFDADCLRNLIARTLDDTANPEIRMGTILAGGSKDIPKIREALLDWQEKGYLKIINDPAECTDRNAICVLMLSYIEYPDYHPDYVKWKTP